MRRSKTLLLKLPIVGSIALTLDGSPVATAKQSALFFLKITVRGKKKFSSRLSPVSPGGVTPICKGRDGSARPSSFSFSPDLVNGVQAREQRAAKPLDARNEGTRVVICVSRALCSIEPSACRLTGMGEKLVSKASGGKVSGGNFFCRFTPLFAFYQLRSLVPRLMLI